MTARSDFRERPEFKLGRSREQLHARFAMRSGFFVLPTYDYSGGDEEKAPRLEGQRESFALPDLLLYRAGHGHFEEVKSKTKANHRNVKGYCEHGVNERNYSHYLAVQKESGERVYLVIYEEATRLVLIASLRDLGEPRVAPLYGSRGPLIANWPRSRFWVWARFTDSKVENVQRRPAHPCPATCAAYRERQAMRRQLDELVPVHRGAE